MGEYMDRDEKDYEFWEERPNPTDGDIADLCNGWFAYARESREKDKKRGDDPPSVDEASVTAYLQQRLEEDAGEPAPNWWAAEAVMDAWSHGGLPMQWRIILGLCATVPEEDDWLIMRIGVGPIEAALMDHGERAMDLIEPAAEADPILHEALTSVWLHREPIRPRLDRYLAQERR